ncbi:hypothetical protein Taro_028788 [Colocasia esculenta]|uniref:MULE transposase domain-containing protein n=1 Tax=Colocasia esculenta TaxID=4460 RepID=A0A843VM36_COLES|nr:hypothetical protein [Colocasia esculenta]
MVPKKLNAMQSTTKSSSMENVAMQCGSPAPEVEDDLNHDKGESESLEPFDDMIFKSISDAQKLYNTYAKRVGFGIRGGKDAISHRDSSKIGCKTSVRVRHDKDTNTYIMYDVILEYNHILHPTTAMYFRSHRKICTPKKAEILNMRSVGISTSNIVLAMAKRKGGIQQLEWIEKDCINFLDKERQTQLKEGDAKTMINHFQTMQVRDPTFFYTIAVNDNGTLRNVFWIDGRSRTSCTYFADVICFNTTYLTNTYQMPFALFVGVNHHGQSILLRCALLTNEKIEKANGGIHPRAIITDQDKAIEAAVA